MNSIALYNFSFYGNVKVIMLTLRAVDRGFESGSSKIKDCNVALRRNSKDGFVWNRDNVSKWGDMFIRELLFQRTSTIKIQLSVLV